MTKDRLLKGLYRGEISALQEIITMLEYDSIIIIPEGATNGEVINLVFPNEVWGREFNEKWMKAHYRK